MKFTLINGSTCHDHRMYYAGDIIDTDRDLCKSFPGRFRRVSEKKKASDGISLDTPMVPSVNTIDTIPELDEEEIEEMEEEPEEEIEISKKTAKKVSKTSAKKTSSKGVDVTKTFPVAVDQDFKVMKIGNAYQVIDNETEEVIHDGMLKKNSVNKTIKEYLG